MRDGFRFTQPVLRAAGLVSCQGGNDGQGQGQGSGAELSIGVLAKATRVARSGVAAAAGTGGRDRAGGGARLTRANGGKKW